MTKQEKAIARGDKHPYMLTYKWTNGHLAFWRKSPGLYSKQAIEYYEACLKRWVEKENNMSTLNEKPS
jgi:hypothetical protein